MVHQIISQDYLLQRFLQVFERDLPLFVNLAHGMILSYSISTLDLSNHNSNSKTYTLGSFFRRKLLLEER